MIPDDIHRLIFEFTFNKPITQKKFHTECAVIRQVRECIPPTFLRSVVWCRISKELVPNPYREFAPYHPLTIIQKRSIFEQGLSSVLWKLSNTFFSRIHSYRTTFRRYLYKLTCFGVMHWDPIYLKYLVHITPSDFMSLEPDDSPLLVALDGANCF
jgi:hypothetical protein